MDFPCPIATYSDNKKPRSQDNQDPDSKKQCTWAGPLHQLKHHCTTLHTVYPTHDTIAPTIVIGVDICIPFICWGDFFLFKQHYLKLRDEVFWTLQFVGDPNQASRFVLRVTVRRPVVYTPLQFTIQCQSFLLKDEDLVINKIGMPRANIILPKVAKPDPEHALQLQVLRVREERTYFDLRSRNL